MTIFVDMDGVLVDFINGACPVFGITYEEILKKWPEGVWDMDHVLGISAEQFYEKIEAQGAAYWERLKAYPWADDLWKICQVYAPTYILTTPTYDPVCLAGKVSWLQNWKHKRFRDYVITPHKERCARWDRLLIDDREENVLKFRQHGGSAILFPAHTNPAYRFKSDPMSVVTKELEKWHGRMVEYQQRMERWDLEASKNV